MLFRSQIVITSFVLIWFIASCYKGNICYHREFGKYAEYIEQYIYIYTHTENNALFFLSDIKIVVV